MKKILFSDIIEKKPKENFLINWWSKFKEIEAVCIVGQPTIFTF